MKVCLNAEWLDGGFKSLVKPRGEAGQVIKVLMSSLLKKKEKRKEEEEEEEEGKAEGRTELKYLCAKPLG